MDDKLTKLCQSALVRMKDMLNDGDCVIGLYQTEEDYCQAKAETEDLYESLSHESEVVEQEVAVSVLYDYVALCVHYHKNYLMLNIFQEAFGGGCVQFNDNLLREAERYRVVPITLTAEEIYHGLKFIGDNERVRAVLSLDIEHFDGLYASFANDRIAEFKQLVNQCGGQRKMSLMVLSCVLSNAQEMFKSILSTPLKMLENNLDDIMECYLPSVTQLMHQEKQFWELTNAEIERETLIEECEKFCRLFDAAFSEMKAFAFFLIGLFKIPVFKQRKLEKRANVDLYLLDKKEATGIEGEQMLNDLSYFDKHYLKMAHARIQKYMVDNKVWIRMEGGLTAERFVHFVKKNFIINANYLEEFKNKYSRHFVKFIDDINSTRRLYAFIYLLFPITVKPGKTSKKSMEICLAPHLRWVYTPQDTNDAVERFLETFPEKGIYANKDSDDAKPGMQRKYLAEYIKGEGHGMLSIYIKTFWNKSIINQYGAVFKEEWD